MSARSTNVTLKNATTGLLVLTSSGLQHGVWNPAPPTIITPSGQGVWENDSDGFMTGDQGYVTYKLILGSASVGDVNFSWDNPYVGSNGYGESCPAGYNISYTGGSGNNAVVVVTLSIAAGATETLHQTTVEK
ncbi:MAG: hypothetical protein P4M00_25230 [Azospirillaceae bacterium]|nr:hypothetical protein [Azospirillaceae bacterium]